MSIQKTVYILGAGFSGPAGGPPQDAILGEIWNLPDSPEIEPHKTRLKGFLQNVLNVDEKKVSLEDIYTPIDRCLADGIALRGASEDELQKLRDSIGYLIAQAIKSRFDRWPVTSSGYVNDFAKNLVGQAAVRAEKAKGQKFASEAKKHDPFSIISLNWDILLDNAINNALKAKDLRPDGSMMDGDYEPFGVVDYCCYISSLDANERRIRTGLWSLGCKGYNVKLLKIHGSMNWLQCPNCQQLFVGYDDKLIIPNFSAPQLCRHCQKQGNSSYLRGSLVMPTFLKDLTNFQVKLIWQNAGVEIMEARKLVFIGYSLPHADFEFRQLLSRMVHKDAKIEVVLLGSSPGFSEEKKRYESFFSKHTLAFEPLGVIEFVRKLGVTTTP
jgi:NAD-dependent SIR2 family protein deacetylase